MANTPYSKENINSCTYAINGEKVNACETIEEQSKVIDKIVRGENVEIATVTKDCDKDEYIYIRNDRIRQATSDENIKKERETFVIDQFQ